MKMMNGMNGMNVMKPITNFYKNLSSWGKILIGVLLLLIVISFFKGLKAFGPIEGFQQNDKFLIKSGTEVYDNFYVNIYDHLVYNNLKDNYEIGQIVNATKPTSESIILDVGSGTGHHVAALEAKGFKASGVDISEAMVAKAKENYPEYDFYQRDVTYALAFEPSSYTHILCLYFTIYYMKDKRTFFENCMTWLQPGGYLIVHLVDRDKFDPILPPGNPLMMVSPQRYAKERIKHTNVAFDDFKYRSDFDIDNSKNVATFKEKFTGKDGKTRKNEHTLYMESDDMILQEALDVGFIIQGKIDLVKVAYEYQYLYILVKPT